MQVLVVVSDGLATLTLNRWDWQLAAAFKAVGMHSDANTLLTMQAQGSQLAERQHGGAHVAAVEHMERGCFIRRCQCGSHHRQRLRGQGAAERIFQPSHYGWPR